MPWSICGAPSAYTDAGPPERITAIGLRRRRSSALARCETSSEYTRASRTRRAISCEYCPPRSTTSTGRSSASRAGRTAGSGCSWTNSAAPVIGSVLRDGDVMRMRLTQPGAGDAHEARLLHRLDRLGAAVAHRLTQATDDLVQDVGERPLVGDAAFDPFGDEFLHVLDVTLEIPILREPA